MWLADAIPLSTVQANSLLYFMLFCETHDWVVWEIISVSEKRMKTILWKLLTMFSRKKWRRWVISFKGTIWVFAARPGPHHALESPVAQEPSDRQGVFFYEYHLDVKVAWHGHHSASVPVMSCGVARAKLGVLWTPPKLLPSITAQRLDRLGWDLVHIKLGTQQTINVCVSVTTCTPRLCISETTWPIVFKFDVWVSGH